MNKYVVVYRSKYGATKKYALMLKEELSCEIYDAADYKKIPFERYSYVIFAGAVYAGGMAGLDILRKVYKNIRQFFYARGAWNEGRMTFKDRILCGILGDCQTGGRVSGTVDGRTSAVEGQDM